MVLWKKLLYYGKKLCIYTVNYETLINYGKKIGYYGKNMEP